jgi:hypothetical protein
MENELKVEEKNKVCFLLLSFFREPSILIFFEIINYNNNNNNNAEIHNFTIVYSVK